MTMTEIAELHTAAGKAIAELDTTPIRAAAEILHRVRLSHGVVLTAGNGGSSSTASHFAGDLTKFPRSPRWPHLRAVALADNVACHTAWANDDVPGLSSMHLAEPWLQLPRPEVTNAVVLFSVHGGSRDGSVSNNLVELARYARHQSAQVIAVTGFDGGALSELADAHINVAMHEEPLATPGIESVHLLIAHALCLVLLKMAGNP